MGDAMRREAIEKAVLDALTNSHEKGRESMLEAVLDGDFGDPADWHPYKREAFASAVALALTEGSAGT